MVTHNTNVRMAMPNTTGTKIKPAVLDSFESITGKGIKASYEGHTYWVGSHKLLKDISATVNDVMAEMLVHYESDGNGIIYFGREKELLAIIAVSDPIKATSAEAVKELKRQGIDICILTGDGQRTALAVSSRNAFKAIQRGRFYFFFVLKRRDNSAGKRMLRFHFRS